MGVPELAEFFQAEEGERLAPETVRHIIASCEPCPELRDRGRLSETGFSVMFTTSRMNIRKPCCLGVYQVRCAAIRAISYQLLDFMLSK